MKTEITTLSIKTPIGRSPLRPGLPRVQRIWIIRGFLLIPLALAWFALSPTAQAQLSPSPDGGYPNANTAEGLDALYSLTTGKNNTANGYAALFSNTMGGDNTATGVQALARNTTGNFNTATGSQALFSNTTINGVSGSGNTAMGFAALYSNTTGFFNTATGGNALLSNTTGHDNTATGADALVGNTTGVDNTATGFEALAVNTTGAANTATGSFALFSNTTGGGNTASGLNALYSNTTGFFNTANGLSALYSNTTGSNNTANGFNSLLQNTTGQHNTATGYAALYHNTTGSDNTANGYEALFSNTTGGSNTANGLFALLRNTTGKFNIALGFQAGQNLTTGDNNIDIGNQGVAGEANTVRIGTVGTQTATYLAGIMGKTVPMGTPVFINAQGQLGTAASSARFKDEIKPMNKASEAILALRPVTFHYKKEIDPDRAPQFGLVAEEVEKVNRALVTRDADGKIYTVRYDAVNAMLLNEFLKEHRTVQELKSALARQETTTARQQKQIEALTAGLQRVSDQLELSKPAPRMALNNQVGAVH